MKEISLKSYGFEDPLNYADRINLRYGREVIQMSEWKEAKGGDVVKLEEGQKIEGKLLSIEQSKQYEDSYAVTIQVGEDKKTVFVNNIVKDLIDTNNIKNGQEISIVYKGMKKNEAGTRDYKNYEVHYK